MTAQNKQKTQTLWTIAHEKFALKHKLCPAARLLWHWLLLEGELGKESEPDFKEFNNWVKSERGAPFSRVWIKHAFKQLLECRVIQLVKTYAWNLVKIVTRSLDLLKPPKKQENLRNRTSTCASPTPSPQSSNEGGINSSDSLEVATKREILQICMEAGIYFDPDSDAEVFIYPLEEVRMAVDYYNARLGGERINNPPGWLITCLRWRWYDYRGVFTRLTEWIKGNA